MNKKFIDNLKISLFLLLCLIISGCTSSIFQNQNQKLTTQFTEKPTSVYYPFDDILIPKELKTIDAETMFVSTPGYTSGIITLKGRVEKNSLYAFFMSNMLNDNWEDVSQIKSSITTIMIFKKPLRWAVIKIREKEYYTYVEIGVAPTSNNDDNIETETTEIYSE
ncbi:MAG: hypothetical protein B6I26_06630 [Desulfobacteraceae bacterium 4572_130]|nr:MAG: hypothetical protein B6I26_06630 [Desulfobacteraceae bacterium 4572_130]